MSEADKLFKKMGYEKEYYRADDVTYSLYEKN